LLSYVLAERLESRQPGTSETVALARRSTVCHGRRCTPPAIGSSIRATSHAKAAALASSTHCSPNGCAGDDR
jgi:hypothetical protein